MSATRSWLFSRAAAMVSAPTHAALGASVGRVTCMPHGTSSCPRAASCWTSAAVVVALRLVMPVTTARGNVAGAAVVAGTGVGDVAAADGVPGFDEVADGGLVGPALVQP